MKSKACTRCRQWKVRCDADECSQMGCTRCRSLKVSCVFDASFKRVSMAKRWQQMQSELSQLKEAQQGVAQLPTKGPSSPQPQDGSAPRGNEALGCERWQPTRSDISQLRQEQQALPRPPITPLPSSRPHNHSSDQDNSIIGATVPSDLISEPSHFPDTVHSGMSQAAPPTVVPGRYLTSNLAHGAASRFEKRIGDIRLTAGQIADLFKRYRTSLHQFLPFAMHESSEIIYERSPLLFWVICAVASSNRVKPRFEPHIRSLIAEILTSPARSVETVQALLIICTWPFSFPSIAEDSSFFYSGLATQLGLQLGLHRSTTTHTHVGGSEQQDAPTDFEYRMTTWLACFVVNEVQASYRGLPQSILVDFSLQCSFNHPKVDPTLSKLCHISRLHIQSSLAIGAKAENVSGLLDSSSRATMIALFGTQYATLLQDQLQPIDDIIERAFLSSRIQLWSFALLDDMPFTPDLVEVYHQAERDAIRLIQLGSERNLSSAPFQVSRSILYSAMVLIKILKSPYATQHEAILDHIDRARQALGSTMVSEKDIVGKACVILQELPILQDKKLTPQIYSRMTASIVYDSLRVHVESKFHTLGSVQSTNEIDLDGFDWDLFQL